MKINKAMLAAGIVTTLATGSLIGIGTVSAQSAEGQTSVIDKLVSKFNLNREEVESVFEEAHDEHHSEMEANRTQKLQSLVDEGKISNEQKSALEAKFEEQEAAREAIKDEDLTREERREKIKSVMEEFNAWAEEQGINLDLVRPDMGERFGGHHGPRHGMEGGGTEE